MRIEVKLFPVHLMLCYYLIEFWAELTLSLLYTATLKSFKVAEPELDNIIY